MTLISARLPEVIDWADGLKDPIRITLPPPIFILRNEAELSSLFTLIVQGMLDVVKSILFDIYAILAKRRRA